MCGAMAEYDMYNEKLRSYIYGVQEKHNAYAGTQRLTPKQEKINTC